MKLIFVLLSLLFVANAEAAYHTSCTVEGGMARGYVHNQGESFKIEGKIWFYFFNANHGLIDGVQSDEVEQISAGATEEAVRMRAPAGTVSCSFDLARAVVPGPGPIEAPKDIRYSTSCKIKDGKGIGYVHNFGDAFTIDGNVVFYFFDGAAGLIDGQDEYEYANIAGKGTEEVDRIGAPAGAVSCVFDIVPAIRR